MSMAKLPIEVKLDFRLEPSKRPGLEEVLTGAEVLSCPAPGTVEDNSNVQRSVFNVQRSAGGVIGLSSLGAFSRCLNFRPRKLESFR